MCHLKWNNLDNTLHSQSDFLSIYRFGEAFKLIHLCNILHYLSLFARNPVSGFPTRSNTNWTVQPHKMARGS